jgi:hypothetical protein
VLDTLTANPLALVAGATVGGMIVGRIMRNRARPQGEGYLRNIPGGEYYPSFSGQSFPEYHAPNVWDRPQHQNFQGSRPAAWNREQPAWGYQGFQAGYPQNYQPRNQQDFDRSGYPQPSQRGYGGPGYRPAGEQQFQQDFQQEDEQGFQRPDWS